MGIYLQFFLSVSYMVVTYRMIALKYRKSHAFSVLSDCSKAFLVALHVFIVLSNIFLYFWFISKDFHPASSAFSAIGILIFIAGLLVIFLGANPLGKAVFIPENKLATRGIFKKVRHPMYLGGIMGALGLSILAGSPLALVYSFIPALVLNHIADAEEEDLKIRFGEEYENYMKKVPKLIPHAW